VGPAIIFLQHKTRSSQSALRGPAQSGEPPVLVDTEMKNAYELLSRAAQSDVTVLILGETGVGKEMMAESVHRRSRRASRPYLQLNCAALPEQLLESEMFGHEKGSFTGAHVTKVGLLESTDGGTVFLDEIGELALGTQAKLLRVLEERTLLRVGSTKPRQINVRFVTATNRDLARESRAGRFRSDLYYRISGIVVRVPPLRQRPVEIEPLSMHFLRQFCKSLDQPEPQLSLEALAALSSHDWPGNVRELRNVIERAALMAGSDPIRREHILLDTPVAPGPGAEPEAPTEVTMRNEYRELLAATRRGRGADARHSRSPQSSNDSSRAPDSIRHSSRSPASANRLSLTPESQAELSSGPASSYTPPAHRDSPAHDEERTQLIAALDACAGNQTRAAKMLGISPASSSGSCRAPRSARH
jgi:transcriptional regulator with GAF, ATPase, and Fis domain